MEYGRLKDSTMELGSRQYVKYMIKKVSVGDQKNGGKYMSLVIGDNDTEYQDVKIFGVNDNMIDRIVAGKVYKGAIDVKEYMGRKSLIIYNIDYCNDENVMDYVSYEYGYNIHNSNLYKEINNIGYNKPELKNLIEEMLLAVGNKFWTHTAGVSMHHTKLGGLVVHTSEVLETAKSIANSCWYRELINYDLLRTACIVHDIGKCVELEVDSLTGVTKYGVDGCLEGHITLGVEILNKAYNSLLVSGVDIGEDSIRIIRHCILSHHGKLEYGSPVMPSTVEAKILNYADLISSDLYRARNEMASIESGDISSKWIRNECINVYKGIDIGN